MKYRSSFLMQYFGESNNVRCGICDVCLERNKLEISDSEFEKIANVRAIIKRIGKTCRLNYSKNR